MKVGVIGVGKMGTNHIKSFCNIKDATLVGCCDVDKDRVNEISTLYNIKGYYNYRDMINDIDAVIIATQTIYHYDIAKFFMENGKHVLVEKPITFKYDEAEKLIEIAKENNVKFTVGHVERFNPVIDVLKDIFNSNETIAMSVKRMSPVDNRVQDIDVVLDLMIHDIDAILYIMDGKKINNIEAIGRSVKKESIEQKNCDYAVAYIYFNNGVIVDLTASRVTEKKIRNLYINGIDKFIEVNYIDKSITIFSQLERNSEDKIGYKNEFITKEAFIINKDALSEQNQNFVDSIVRNVPLKVKAEEALIDLKVVNIIREKIYNKKFI